MTQIDYDEIFAELHRNGRLFCFFRLFDGFLAGDGFHMCGFLLRRRRLQNLLRRQSERAHDFQPRTVPITVRRPIQRVIRPRTRPLRAHGGRTRPIVGENPTTFSHVLSQRLEKRRRRVVRALSIRSHHPRCRHLHLCRRVTVHTLFSRSPDHLPIDDLRPVSDGRASSSGRRLFEIFVVVALVLILPVIRAHLVILLLRRVTGRLRSLTISLFIRLARVLLPRARSSLDRDRSRRRGRLDDIIIHRLRLTVLARGRALLGGFLGHAKHAARVHRATSSSRARGRGARLGF